MSNERRKLDSSENVSRYNVCSSKFHWASNCPEAFENQYYSEEKKPEKINLFQSPNHSSEEIRVFVGETLSCAVLDSGCTQAVCRRKWL